MGFDFLSCSATITFGPVLKQSNGRLIGANPTIQADITHIYCASCQTFVGWRIVSIYFILLYILYCLTFFIRVLIILGHDVTQVRQYGPHTIIREGQCILLLGIGGAVTSMNKKSHLA